MKKTLLGLLISATLCGCSMFAEDNTTANNNYSQNPNAEIASPLESSMAFQQQYANRFSTPQDNTYVNANQANQMQPARMNSQQNASMRSQPAQQVMTNTKPQINHDINYYVRGMMQDLVANLQYVNSTTPVAVVSFVMLDSDYNDANLLGIQIAESLIHEVHKFGIPVIDFKTTGYIRVTEQGDFAFSKDFEDFDGELPARYIVGGTMLKNTDGYLINARIVGVESQAVVATAQSFIPNHVSEQILSMATSVKKSSQSIELSKLNNDGFYAPANVSLTVEKTTSGKTSDGHANHSRSNSVTLIQD